MLILYGFSHIVEDCIIVFTWAGDLSELIEYKKVSKSTNLRVCSSVDAVLRDHSKVSSFTIKFGLRVNWFPS